MPCYDPSSTRSAGIEDAQHNSPVAELLCGLITALLASNTPIPEVNGLLPWWVEHQKRDAARK